MKESTPESVPVLQARGLVKRYGRVTALNGSDFDLVAGEEIFLGDEGRDEAEQQDDQKVDQ